MDAKKAFKTGKYINQYAAMDANNFALEGAGLNYTLWCYCHNVPAPSYNTHLIIRTPMNGVIFGMARIWPSGAKKTNPPNHQIPSTRKESSTSNINPGTPTPATNPSTMKYGTATNPSRLTWLSHSHIKPALKTGREPWRLSSVLPPSSQPERPLRMPLISQLVPLK